MRLLDTNTRYFDRETYQIPQLTNAWGCIVSFLDQALVYGSQPQNILSFKLEEDPKYPEDYWYITLTTDILHGFKANLSVIEIKECFYEILNGVFRVQDVSENSFSIAIDKKTTPVLTLESLSTVGMQVTTASLGYEKIYEAPQKAVYKTTTKEDKYCYLRVDNSCPEGHDPSWAKFARVSMFENMSHIDDYEYSLERKKSPLYSEDTNRVEEDIQNVWLSTRWLYDDYVNFRAVPNTGDDLFFLIGDSSTFYLHIKELRRESHGDSARDETYIFGEYDKLQYKEDPLPFILRSSRRETFTSDYFTYYTQKSNITLNSDWCNTTFNSSPNSILKINTHETFANYLDYTSGRDTQISFMPYQNELNLNIFEMYLKFFRSGNTVLEGKYRGLKTILSNLKDYPEHAPREYEVFEQKGEFFFTLRDANHYVSTSTRDYAKFLVDLKNWS